jgi:hypothetical protein
VSAARGTEAASGKIPLFPLTVVDFSDLSVLDEQAVSTVANALTTGEYVIVVFDNNISGIIGLIILNYYFSILEIYLAVGALQITGIPHFSASRAKALLPAAACLSADSAAPTMQMGDGKRRVSSAALTSQGVPGEMSGVCGQAADSLRAAVDGAVYQLLKAMDKYTGTFQNNDQRKTPEFVMEPYRRYSDIYQNGEHLGREQIFLICICVVL